MCFTFVDCSENDPYCRYNEINYRTGNTIFRQEWRGERPVNGRNVIDTSASINRMWNWPLSVVTSLKVFHFTFCIPPLFTFYPPIITFLPHLVFFRLRLSPVVFCSSSRHHIVLSIHLNAVLSFHPCTAGFGSPVAEFQPCPPYSTRLSNAFICVDHYLVPFCVAPCGLNSQLLALSRFHLFLSSLFLPPIYI